MTTPTTKTVVPVVRLAWPIVAILAILACLFVALYALAPDDAKPSLGPLFSLFGSIPAAAAGIAAYVQSRRNAQQVEQHGVTISKIDAQTNGSLDARITSAVGQAIDERPALFTDAAIARGLSNVLEKHLQAAQEAAGEPATVSTVTTIRPASGAPQTPDQPPA